MSIAGFGGSKVVGAAPNGAPPSADAEFRALLREAKMQTDAGAAEKAKPVNVTTLSLPLPKFGRKAHFYAVAGFVWVIGAVILSIMPQNPSLWELALLQLPVCGIIVAAHTLNRKKKA
jgi:hypothetical protein